MRLDGTHGIARLRAHQNLNKVIYAAIHYGNGLNKNDCCSLIEVVVKTMCGLQMRRRTI